MKIDVSRLAKSVESLYPESSIAAHVVNASLQLEPEIALRAVVQSVQTVIVTCVQDQLDEQEVSNSYAGLEDEEFWKACVLAGLQNSAVDQAIDDADRALATLIDRRKPLWEQAE